MNFYKKLNIHVSTHTSCVPRNLSSMLLCLLLALPSLVDLSFFQNCSPVFSVLRLRSQIVLPMFFRSSSTDSSHLKLGSFTRRLRSVLRREDVNSIQYSILGNLLWRWQPVIRNVLLWFFQFEWKAVLLRQLEAVKLGAMILGVLLC